MKTQSAASVKARLMNRAKVTGKTMQELLVAYGLDLRDYSFFIIPLHMGSSGNHRLKWRT